MIVLDIAYGGFYDSTHVPFLLRHHSVLDDHLPFDRLPSLVDFFKIRDFLFRKFMYL